MPVAANGHIWGIITMKWGELPATMAAEPVFNTGFLVAGRVDAAHQRRQFSRWVNNGRLLQLRLRWAEKYGSASVIGLSCSRGRSTDVCMLPKSVLWNLRPERI
jgi:hypothetical protein